MMQKERNSRIRREGEIEELKARVNRLQPWSQLWSAAQTVAGYAFTVLLSTVVRHVYAKCQLESQLADCQRKYDEVFAAKLKVESSNLELEKQVCVVCVCVCVCV